jgi:L-asparaginase/Glu-tRNA(Gln) amidotransferase subunit D
MVNALGKRRLTISLMVVAVAATVQFAAAQHTKPNIVILATGGTIAGAASTGTQPGYTSGAVSIDTMLAAVLESVTWPISRGSKSLMSDPKT